MEFSISYDLKTDCFTNENGTFISIVCPPGTEYTSYHLKQDLKAYHSKYKFALDFIFITNGEIKKDKLFTIDDLKKCYEYTICQFYSLQAILDEINNEVN